MSRMDKSLEKEKRWVSFQGLEGRGEERMAASLLFGIDELSGTS